MPQRNGTTPAIGRASIIGTLDAADTEPIVRRTSHDHAPWCERRDLCEDVCDRIGHVSAVTVVPATGQWTGALVDDGALFPFVEILAQTEKTGGRDAAGTPSVALTLTSPREDGDLPRSITAILAPSTVRTFVADLRALAAGGHEATRAPGRDSAVWAATAAGQAGLLVVDMLRPRQVSAVLRLDELGRMADALAAAVDMVTR